MILQGGEGTIVPDIIIYSYRQGGAPVNLGVPSFFIW